MYSSSRGLQTSREIASVGAPLAMALFYIFIVLTHYTGGMPYGCANPETQHLSIITTHVKIESGPAQTRCDPCSSPFRRNPGDDCGYYRDYVHFTRIIR